MADERCIRCAERVPWFSLVGNFSLTVYKIVVGLLGGSGALIADGLHSGTDVVGTSMILFSRRVSSQPPDEDHPYGHGKVEFMSSAFIYIVLFVVAIAITIGAIAIIMAGDLRPPRFVTLLAAVVSVLYNVLMYQFGTCAGKKVNSPALLANAFENRADAISSVAVVLGIAAATFIHPICDPLAALVVGIVIGVNSVTELRKSFSGLMDVAVPAEVLRRIEQLAESQDGVTGIDFVKTRETGHGVWVDVGIFVPGDVDVVEADAIAKSVRTEILSRMEDVDRVEVFVAAEAAPERRRSPA
jgi:cation diffusion facilitator family transporter